LVGFAVDRDEFSCASPGWATARTPQSSVVQASPFRWAPGDIDPNHLRAESAPVLGKRAQVEVDAGVYQRVGVIMAGGGGAREVVAQGEPGDRLLLFGVCRGAYCAAAPARLPVTVSLLSARSDNLMDHVLATYALPRTSRTPQEWRRITWLASTLCRRRDTAVPMHFLGCGAR
jgi:hypothetical protein